MTNFKHIELHGEECWCYPEESPIYKKDMKLGWPLERLSDFEDRRTEWQNSKQIITFAYGEYEKIMNRTFYPSIIKPQVEIDITRLVQIKDGLAYLCLPVYVEQSAQEYHRGEYLTVSAMRDLEKQVNNGEISYSKMLELINERIGWKPGEWHRLKNKK